MQRFIWHYSIKKFDEELTKLLTKGWIVIRMSVTINTKWALLAYEGRKTDDDGDRTGS